MVDIVNAKNVKTHRVVEAKEAIKYEPILSSMY